jgi:hypothetical protein
VNLQHYDTDGKRALRLHAVPSLRLVGHNVAALGDIPWRALVLVRGIDGVARGLYVYSVGPKTEQRAVQHEREDGQEDFEEPHAWLDQPEEHAQDADDEVVLGVAGFVLAFNLGIELAMLLRYRAHVCSSTYKLLHTTGTVTGR